MAQLYVHEACDKGKLATVKELIDDGASATDLDGGTGSLPIHWAARGAHYDCVKYLIDNKINDVSFKNFKGNTPLHYATISGTKKVTQLLVEAGADINALNKDGQTPLHGAVGCNWDHVVKYLASVRDDTCRDCRKKKCRKHMVDLNAQDGHGRTPLHYASGLFTSGMFDLLLSLGADPTIKSDDGEIPKCPRDKYSDAIKSNGLMLLAVLGILMAYLYYENKEAMPHILEKVQRLEWPF